MKKIQSLVKMLENLDNEDIYDFLFNLLLVLRDGRKAYLFESSNFMHMSGKKKIDDLLKIAKDCDLFVQKDPVSLDDYPRYWIVKEKLNKIPLTDKAIGKLLGMKDPGDDYFNYKEKRLTLYIKESTTGVNINTEILKGDKDDKENIDHAKNRIDAFNTIMIELDLPYRFSYIFNQDDGSLKRFKELKKKNMKYIQENVEEYVNDLYNIVVEKDTQHPLMYFFEKCAKNESLLTTYLPVYVYVYRIFNEELYVGEEPSLHIRKINKKFADHIQKQTRRVCLKKGKAKVSKRKTHKKT